MRSEAEIRAALELSMSLPAGPQMDVWVMALRWVLNDPPPPPIGVDVAAEINSRDTEIDRLRGLCLELEKSLYDVKAQRDTVSRQLAEARKG